MTWERRIASGSSAADLAELERASAEARSQGLSLQVESLPSGGYFVRAVRGDFAGAPAYAHSGFGQGGFGSGGFGSGGSGGFAEHEQAAQSASARVVYLRKVYGLLAASALLAVVCGWLGSNIGVSEVPLEGGGVVRISALTQLVMSSRAVSLVMFGLLFASTFVAGMVRDNPKLSTVALFAIAALIGIEAAPFLEVATISAGFGQTMTASPVRDAAVLSLTVFAGLTTYVAVTKKDFSYLAATFSIGFWLVFAGSILGLFFRSEVFSLAIASVGAIVMAGLILVHTSRIFRDSEMDNPAYDALGLLIMLRNLFLMLLRIFSSRRD